MFKSFWHLNYSTMLTIWTIKENSFSYASCNQSANYSDFDRLDVNLLRRSKVLFESQWKHSIENNSTHRGMLTGRPSPRKRHEDKKSNRPETRKKYFCWMNDKQSNKNFYESEWRVQWHFRMIKDLGKDIFLLYYRGRSKLNNLASMPICTY